MKELLHSKVFKQKLRKWLMMYCGVMFVFTTVVTYSRYITQKYEITVSLEYDKINKYCKP